MIVLLREKKSASLLANFYVKLSDLISSECTTHAAQSTHVSVFLRKPVAKKHERRSSERESASVRVCVSHLFFDFIILCYGCIMWSVGTGRDFLMLFIWDHNSVSAASLSVRVCKIAPFLFSKVIYV